MKTGTVRRSLRDILAELEQQHPNLKNTLLSALANVNHSRLLDLRYLDLDNATEDEPTADSPFPVLSDEVFTES